MTVKKLIKILQTMPQDAIVITYADEDDGCVTKVIHCTKNDIVTCVDEDDEEHTWLELNNYPYCQGNHTALSLLLDTNTQNIVCIAAT